MESPPKMRVALMIPCNIGTFYAHVGVIGQVCLDEVSPLCVYAKYQTGSAAQRKSE
jgi:hypothetical protein